ncbi:ISL3 family transposase [Desulforamulus hydrothermalis]|uniref:Transposase n=6 Tax=Desulforamulus TaxID=2916693 RepID=K8DYY1_9FIRM|nr:ISL3 family transposase [Desulforamulus hydrothermalis]CCO07916.1 transposase [Desulforamulus hydrothermalis Lam5 = DSM 18033]CCO08139.1 transposase [Desulforamulus hydrothermalis Lam5 = DSM 18033]CCO08514.1 transposase [Desulforamulus hydrothermalis Lam5 = DSM 18033]
MQFQSIRNFINLKDVIISNVEHFDSHSEISLSMPVRPHKCPACGTLTKSIHDYRTQKIKDIPWLNKPLYLIYRKRRYNCRKCNKKFYEQVDFIGKYQRMTKRLIMAVVDRLRSNSSMCSVADDFSLSPCTITRIFDYLSYSLKELPTVLSIDEFKGTTDKGKYHCILADPISSKVLDILESRTQDYLVSYFKKFNNLDKVKYVVIDMWGPYKRAAELVFPNATIVIDRFHYVRNCIWAIDKVRKRVQQSLPYEKRRFLKFSRRLLLSRPDKLSDDSKIKLANILRFNDELRVSYLLKEQFMDFVKASSSVEAESKLNRWLNLVKQHKIKEFYYLANTIVNWKTEILNSFDVPYSNGCIEGYNNKIKVIKRNAFGFRNFNRFRSRILHCCA